MSSDEIRSPKVSGPFDVPIGYYRGLQICTRQRFARENPNLVGIDQSKPCAAILEEVIQHIRLGLDVEKHRHKTRPNGSVESRWKYGGVVEEECNAFAALKTGGDEGMPPAAGAGAAPAAPATPPAAKPVPIAPADADTPAAAPAIPAPAGAAMKPAAAPAVK